MTATECIQATWEAQPGYVAPITWDDYAEMVGYSEELENLLARLISAECGADWCKDEMLWYTGSVVLNRIKSEDFPNTMQEVIYQPGQYGVVSNGTITRPANERSDRIAQDLLLFGSVLPDDVVFQSNEIQGSEIYAQVQNMYFCRK